MTAEKDTEMTDNQIAIDMKYIGLLTNEQKKAGYFVSQSQDFVWLWRSRPHVDCIAIFLYQNATIKQVRESAQSDIEMVS